MTKPKTVKQGRDGALAEVCEMFDVQVLRDYWLGTDEHPEIGHSMFALGQKPELDAGLRGFRMTQWFHRMEELSAFCARNLERFREVAKDNDAPAPDATKLGIGNEKHE